MTGGGIPLLSAIFGASLFEKIHPALIDETTDGHVDGDHAAAIIFPSNAL